MKSFPAVLASLALVGFLSLRLAAAPLADRDATDLAQFEHKVALEKELGATHVLITEDLPLATWEMDRADPYPAWFVHHASLLKIFPPAKVAPFVDAGYAEHVSAIVEARCTVLRKYGLKAVWSANEPAVLPEAFFTAYPELRGPQIDQANRSRKAHFSPNVDNPEMLGLYREAIQQLLKRCPEVELFTWVTTDAGSGFDWSPALYPGINGNSTYRDRPLSERVSKFLINAQQAAKDVGHSIEISLNPIAPRQWMIPTFGPEVLHNILEKLPRGLAVEGKEGPDGRPFVTGAAPGLAGRAFYPVVGLGIPNLEADYGRTASAGSRVIINLGDATSIDATYRLFKATRGQPMHTLVQRVTALRAFAVTEVGEEQADQLLEAWSSLNQAERNLAVLDFGGMLRFGHVLNRWVNRPMVPFPEKLTDSEKADYRRFLFQAKGEAQANDLADIQAMQMYKGWGAKLLFQHTIELTVPLVRRAQERYAGFASSAKDEATRRSWELGAKRLQALIYLLQSADNNVAYQAQLDRVKAIAAKPEADPVLGVQSGWDRTDLMATARREVDVTVALKQLLESTPEPLLDLAPSPADETIMRLGPDLAAQLKHKIDTINAHWRDYDALFTVPNP